MSELLIHKDCQHCNGEGLLPDSITFEATGPACEICVGTGKLGLRYLSLGTNVFHSHVIMEELDTKEYNVSQQTICDIKKRRSWKHV